MKTARLIESPYCATDARIVRTRMLTENEKFFEIALAGGARLDHEPGQFVMVSIPGVGEAPISIASSPTRRGSFDLVVRKAGRVTGALHRMEVSDRLGIRGPFGKGFPLQVLEGNDLLIVAGGLGLVPLRSLIQFVFDNRRDFGSVNILLGCKSPKELLFSDELAAWSERMDINFSCTVDRADPDWKGNIGLITALIPGVTLDPNRTFGIVVGPPVMYRFVIIELLKKNIPERQILVSLERHMKCGLGKCGHCQMDAIYCCQDGPVFSLDRIKNLKGAI